MSLNLTMFARRGGTRDARRETFACQLENVLIPESFPNIKPVRSGHSGMKSARTSFHELTFECIDSVVHLQSLMGCRSRERIKCPAFQFSKIVQSGPAFNHGDVEATLALLIAFAVATHQA